MTHDDSPLDDEETSPIDGDTADDMEDEDEEDLPPVTVESLLHDLQVCLKNGRPHLVADAFGEGHYPTEEEFAAGQRPSIRMRYVVTIGMSLLTGDPETPELFAFLPERSIPILFAIAKAWRKQRRSEKQQGQEPSVLWPTGTLLEGFGAHPVKLSPVHEANVLEVVREWRAFCDHPVRCLHLLLPDAEGNFPDDKPNFMQPLMVEDWEKLTAKTHFEYGTPLGPDGLPLSPPALPEQAQESRLPDETEPLPS